MERLHRVDCHQLPVVVGAQTCQKTCNLLFRVCVLCNTGTTWGVSTLASEKQRVVVRLDGDSVREAPYVIRMEYGQRERACASGSAASAHPPQ